MKLLRCFIVSFAAVCLTAAVARAQATATISSISGEVTVKLPGAAAPVLATKGMSLPQGTLIVTGATGQAFIEVQPGIVATADKNSSVTVDELNVAANGMRNITLGITKGSVISTLDPAKKDVNNYKVKTPRGVAAARGTVYGVSVTASGTSVATLSGTVTMDLGNGVSVSIPLGNAAVNDSATVTTLAAAIAASGQTGLTVSQLLQETVTAVAQNVAMSSSAVSDPNTATAAMAAVVSAASAADPSQAASFTQTAVAAVTASTSATGGSSAAITAVTEAAVRAAPAQAESIATSAAKAVVETKVTEAVNTAKASGGSTTDAAAKAQAEAAAINTAVAQTVINTATASGNPTVTTNSVASAVNTGSNQGSSAAATTTGTAVATPPNVPLPAPAPANPAPSAPIILPSVDPTINVSVSG